MGIIDSLFNRKSVNIPTFLEDGLMPLNYTFAQRTNENHLIYGYGQNPFVYSVVNFIANNLSTLPLKNPIDLIDSFLYNQIAVSLLVTGNTILVREDAIGYKGTQRLEMLNIREVKLLLDDYYNVVGIRRTLMNGKSIEYNNKEFIHIKYPNLLDVGEDGAWGLSPLTSALTTYESSNNIKKAEASLFDNLGAIGILTNDSDVPIIEKESDKRDNSFKFRSAGTDKFGKILMSNHKLRFLNIGMSPTQLKLIDSNIEKLRTICSIYGVNSVLFNDQVSSSYNNMQTATKNAYLESIIPTMELILNQVNKDLDANIEIDVNNIKSLQDEQGDKEENTGEEKTN